MFNAVISAGVSPRDSAIVELAAKVRDEFVGIAEAAIERGDLTMDQLFDTDYVRVPNSNPERFRTTLCAWADTNWRTLSDRTVGEQPEVLMTSAGEMNRSEEHKSELQSIKTTTYVGFGMKKT